MTQTTKTPPAAKIRSGNLEAAIWANPRKDGNGLRYDITYTRSYKTENGWKESSNFSEVDSLRLSRLITKALDRIDELKAQDKEGGA